ncbi:hypothetical protein K443DRAFT_6800 [Laccaria amethystina LaAM-08-1]|uniref:Uncharacterized protein n=1 Tax=Laccaria amethystina LaAM-08-1 TaxID=1095629 RepID=A0A0C9XVG5_9AGAR|nr:hypothetical protein K443DRAFT_6800 [Laccaria amethystina LaAM-08-1]
MTTITIATIVRPTTIRMVHSLPTTIPPMVIPTIRSYGSSNDDDSYGSSNQNLYGSKGPSKENYGGDSYGSSKTSSDENNSNNDSYCSSNTSSGDKPSTDSENYCSSNAQSSQHSQAGDIIRDTLKSTANKVGYNLDDDAAKISEGLQGGLKKFGGGKFRFYGTVSVG